MLCLSGGSLLEARPGLRAPNSSCARSSEFDFGTPRSTADARVGEDMKQREFEAVREDCEARVGSLAGASYTFLRFAGLSRANVPLGCSPTVRATPPHFVFVQLARTWRVLLEVTWVWKQ